MRYRITRTDQKVARACARRVLRARGGKVPHEELDTLEFPLLRELRRALPGVSSKDRERLLVYTMYRGGSQ
jgi:hypothetical protein